MIIINIVKSLYMTISRTQTAARNQAMAVIIVAIIIAVRDAYISGSGGYYVIALLMLLIPVLNFRPNAKKMRTWSFHDAAMGTFTSRGRRGNARPNCNAPSKPSADKIR